MKVKIPVYLVPRAFVDYDMEQRQILRQDYVLPDGVRIQPLTAGRLMALELVASEFFLHPGSCTQLDIAAALVLLTCRQSLIEEFTTPAPARAAEAAGRGPAPSQSAARSARPTAGATGVPESNAPREAFDGSVDSAARTGDNPSPGAAWSPSGLSAYPELAKAAAAFLNAHADAIFADYPALVRWCIDVPFYGYDMLPKNGPSAPKECWFDGEFAGSVLAPAAKLLATPFEMILWDTPLCIVWHALAQQAAAFGVKGIERPPDAAVLKAMMAEAAARESRGELHPWQYDDPVSYDLTAEQFKRNPNLAQLFARMRADYEKGGHKPLDPADYPLPDPPAHAAEAAGGACTWVVGRACRAPDGAPETSPLDFAISVSPAGRPESVSGAGTAAETITVQDLSWGLHGPTAITIHQPCRLAERGDYNS